MPDVITQHRTGSAQSVAMHRARNEQFCPVCQLYIAALEGERRPEADRQAALREQLIWMNGFHLPAPVFWRLSEIAEATGKTVMEYLIATALVAGRPGLTRSHVVQATEMEERVRIEAEIIETFKSDADLSDAQVALRFNVSREHVRRIRENARIPNVRTRKARRVDPRIKDLAAQGKSDPQIAAILHESVEYIAQRRAAKRIPPGYRNRGSKKK